MNNEEVVNKLLNLLNNKTTTVKLEGDSTEFKNKNKTVKIRSASIQIRSSSIIGM